MNDLWIPDNPDRVGSPDDPGAPYCAGCGESLQPPYYECDGYYCCAECARDYMDDSKHAPEWFMDWWRYMMLDYEENIMPEGD